MTVDSIPFQKVLITGGSGFVGAAIARAVSEKHPACAITILDLTPPGPTHEVPTSATFVRADITQAEEVAEAVERVKPDVIIHTAGIVPVLAERFGRRLEKLVWKTNVNGTENTLAAARRAAVQAFVYTSTCCVVTDDMDAPYPNIDERWPTPRSSLIYGESKVVLYSLLTTAQSFAVTMRRRRLIISDLGCSRSACSRSIW